MQTVSRKGRQIDTQIDKGRQTCRQSAEKADR